MATEEPVAENRSKIVFGVDDSPESLAFLNMTLRAEGYSFVAFASGQQCLDLAHRVAPKLILLDIQMPGIDGFETCRRLRQRSELSNVPIVFLTALKSREDVREGMLAGGNDFIIKPFDRNQMLARVQHWTSRGAEVRSAPRPAKTAAA